MLLTASGIPVSAAYTLAGVVLGVGLAWGIGAIDLREMGVVFTSWMVTLPAGAGLSIILFFMFKGIFVA